MIEETPTTFRSLLFGLLLAIEEGSAQDTPKLREAVASLHAYFEENPQ